MIVRGRRMTLDRGHPEVRVANAERYTRFKAGHPTGFIEAFANYYWDVADSLENVRSGRRTEPSPYVYGLAESLEGLRFLEAITESAKTRQWVTIPVSPQVSR